MNSAVTCCAERLLPGHRSRIGLTEFAEPPANAPVQRKVASTAGLVDSRRRAFDCP